MTDKYQKLLSILNDMQSAVLAFSGGVDSTFLLKALKESGIRFIAVTAVSETMPQEDLKSAAAMAATLAAPHRIIMTDELENPDFVRNPKERCFYCKDELFAKLGQIAATEGYRHVVDGSNADDCADWRPGRKAAQKHRVRSPLIEAELSKEEIRALSKAAGLPTWSKPASPCLSSRFPYGVEITRDALRRVARAEAFLKELGFSELRVRCSHDTARIEVPAEEIERFVDRDLREGVVKAFREFGFKYVSLDLEGFSSGKLNR
ncbi:MAG: ATP-dependent sacrificial sulfur transferase LarE [Nitrospirota bacterium]